LQLKAQENIAKDRYLLSQLETFAEIRPIVFQQQQLQKTLQQLAPQIQQKHNEFSTLTTQFEQQKTLYAQAETTLNQFQDFEQKHQTELTQVRKFVQERDYIAEEYKKTKIRLTQLESQQQPLIEQQQQLEQSIQNLSAQHTACLEQLKHSAQYAPLDKGLNAHIQQLKQFIQQYQKVENTLGSIQQAQTQLEQDQNTFNSLVTQFGTPNKLNSVLSNSRN
jgi:exonuclease SbcC